MSKLYHELAKWWQLVSPPADYADEAAFFLKQLAEITSRPAPSLLELGSGGGNNALHMKGSFASVMLCDLSEEMLKLSRQLNPECEHQQGDMRTMRLNRTFDVVFIHDAIDYMTSLDDLRQALETAFVHCKEGGMALFVPDHIRETFEPDTDDGGEDSPTDKRAVRFFEWTYDLDESDTICTTHYIVASREQDGSVTVTHDEHTLGLFPLADWLRVIGEVGFRADYVIDDYGRYVFVAHKPS